MNEEFNLIKTCTKESFAQFVKCDIGFLKRLFELKDKVTQNTELKKTQLLATTTYSCKCGQFYKSNNDKELGFWLGAHFPTHSKPILMLSLFPAENCSSDFIASLKAEHLTFTEEYIDYENEGYWLSIDLKNPLESDDDTKAAISKITTLIDSFLEKRQKYKENQGQ